MADDSGQRLLDVIDDPSALDEFLGTLGTADAVNDNVVESLARSLAAEFDVDSPNESLFDSSSANLTDISQSAVPFDFGPNDIPHQHGFSTNNPMSNDLNSEAQPSTQFHSSLDVNHAQYSSTTTLTTTAVNYCDSTASSLQRHPQVNGTTDSTTTASFNSNSLEQRVFSQVQKGAVTGPNITDSKQEIQYLSQDSSLSSAPRPETPGSRNIHNQAVISASSNNSSGNVQGAASSKSYTVQVSSEATVAQSNGTISSASAVYATTNTEQTQYASIGQLVQAQQQHVLTGMNQQLLTTNAQGLSLNAQSGASFIIDPSTGQSMMVTSGNTFGTNLLMAGVQPTYTVLPTQASLFSNAITMQPQIQAIKTTHGTTASFLQATSGASLVSQAQPIVTAATTPLNKSKNPPQLLPKPCGTGTGGNNTATTPSATDSSSESSNSTIYVTNASSGTSNVVVTSTAGSITMSSESLSQLIQQQATVTNAGGMSITQPSFAIGTGPLVHVSGMQTLNSISGSQAFFMNQFGQQMIVPTAMSQGGVQFILRQQPQQQVLTIQAPPPTAQISAQQTTTSGKVMRFVSASPQVPQVSQNSIQLQQFQTPQGPTWVAVRSAPMQQPVVSIQPPSPVPVVVTTTPPVTTTPYKPPTPPPPTPQPSPIPPTPSQPPPVVQVTTDTISACIQSVIERLKSPSPPITQTVQSQYSSPITSVDTDGGSSLTDHAPPPKKKPKYTKKKKVTLDLEQLLKQSGIMDEDLQDDDIGFGDFFSSPTITEPENVTGMTPSDQSMTSVQQNGLHNNNNNSITPNNNFYKPNGTPPFTSTVPTHSHILKPIVKSKQRKSQAKNSSSLPQTPPSSSSSPPLPKIPKGKSKKKSTDVIINSEISSSSSPPLPTMPKPSNPKKGKKKQEETEMPPTNVITNSYIISTTPITTPKKTKSKGKKNVKPLQEEAHLDPFPPQIPSPSLPLTPSSRRIVQTIQLTPQNQTLLRNIQAHIQKLLSLTTRNEVEENALQKFINLQTEVIKTGKPVPNPPHLQTLNATPTTTLCASQSALKMGNGVGGMPVVKGALPSGLISPHIPLTVIPTTDGVSLSNGSTNHLPTAKSPSSTPSLLSSCGSTNLPPPLVLNKSCTNAKLLITTTTTTTTAASETAQPTTMETQKIILLSSQGTLLDTSHTPPSDEMTSSSVNSIPTTTLSTSMCSNSNGGMYYNSFDPAMTPIDEKKLEEQLIARLKQDEETRIQWRKEEFEKRLATDHQFFINPDYETKFKTKEDATERLMHFHVGRDTAEITFEEFDADFAETSCHLLNKFSGMVSKYRALLLKESMKEVECAERVMLERMFVAEEKLKLEHDRQIVQLGEMLDLPPPPPNWIPRIRQLVEAEVREMERDSLANQQVQSAIDSIMSFEASDGGTVPVSDDRDKVEYDAFGVPISSSNFNNGMNSSSADIDEAVRSILL